MIIKHYAMGTNEVNELYSALDGVARLGSFNP